MDTFDIYAHPNCWFSPMLASTEVPGKGHATYAQKPIRKGELLVMFGGTVVNGADLKQTPEPLKTLSIQVAEDLFLVSTVVGTGDYINHSCDPNAGLFGQIGLVAMRNIAPGEEICFDYAMSDSVPYDEFECQCGAHNCRGMVTGNDWQNPELWVRYRGYFSPYLQRRIDTLQEQLGLPKEAIIMRPRRTNGVPRETVIIRPRRTTSLPVVRKRRRM